MGKEVVFLLVSVEWIVGEYKRWGRRVSSILIFWLAIESIIIIGKLPIITENGN